MGSDTSGLIFDQSGKARGSFIGEGFFTYKRGRIEGEFVVFSTRRCDFHEQEEDLARLGAFQTLADADNREVRKFARQYGALGLCQHGLPMGHRSGGGGCHGQVRVGHEIRESLAAWRHYAARAKSIVFLAASVAAGQDGEPSHWKVLGSRSMLGRRGAPIPKRGNREYQRLYLAHEVCTWLNECGARPAVIWLETTPQFRLRCPSLIGLIGVDLMSAILGSGSITTCSACGAVYTPKRKPAAGKNHYCAKCGERKKAAKRIWAREKRNRA